MAQQHHDYHPSPAHGPRSRLPSSDSQTGESSTAGRFHQRPIYPPCWDSKEGSSSRAPHPLLPNPETTPTSFILARDSQPSRFSDPPKPIATMPQYTSRDVGDPTQIKKNKQSMADLKLRRLTELNSRLREDLDRERIPVSQASKR